MKIQEIMFLHNDLECYNNYKNVVHCKKGNDNP